MARPADPNARAALISAARSEFVKHGLAKARIEDITAACKLSKGSYYLHFESKEALFGELVGGLDAKIQGMTSARHSEYEVCRGRFDLKKMRTDKRVGEEVMATLADIDARYDRLSLEILWEFRDVVDVLMRGSRGSTFEGFIWQYLDQEVKRIADEVERMRQFGLCRADVPTDVAGSMLVGTFMMLGLRMAAMNEKPDFGYWVKALRVLMTEGMGPGQTAIQAPAKLKSATGRKMTAIRSVKNSSNSKGRVHR